MERLQTEQAEKVFGFFHQIAEIPRGSGNEKQIADFLCAFAQERQLYYYRDSVHNVLIKAPATPDRVGAEPVILQGHTDMVCESTEPYDFQTRGIVPVESGTWLHAQQTTLGADNGIAVAMMLALLDGGPGASHPPLECLFTTQEETGLIGAGKFDYSKITAKRMINLDSEDEGRACVGCAGGCRCDFFREVRRADADPNPIVLRITAKGFAGGHSGMDIAKGRTSANVLLSTVLAEAWHKAKNAPCLYAFSGGKMDNAIARSAQAVISCDAQTDAFLRQRCADYQDTFSADDRDGTLCCEPLEAPGEMPLSLQDADAFLSLCQALPYGVIRFSETLDGLVDTSANFGVCRVSGEGISLAVSIRAIEAAEKEKLKTRLQTVADTWGFSLSFRGDYPGWTYHDDSPIKELYLRTYRALYGAEPVIETIHAGLECGVIQSHIPGLDAISIGPDMEHVHTPAERLSIPSVKRVFAHLKYMLEEM